MAARWTTPKCSKRLPIQSNACHAELTEWIRDDFDPHGGQAEWLTAEVDALARRWSRKRAGKRSRRA